MEYKILKIFNQYFGDFNVLRYVTLRFDMEKITGLYIFADYKITDGYGYSYFEGLTDLEFLANLANHSNGKFYISGFLRHDYFNCKLSGSNYTENNILHEILKHKKMY